MQPSGISGWTLLIIFQLQYLYVESQCASALVFGGYAAGAGTLSDLFLMDTLNSSWTDLTAASETSSSVSPRHGAAYAYSEDLQQAYIYGGYSTQLNNSALSDLYILNTSTYQWSRGPSILDNAALYYTTGIYSAIRSQMIVFGGRTTDNTPSDMLYGYRPLTSAWTILEARSLEGDSTVPGPRCCHSALYLPTVPSAVETARDYMLVHGGYRYGGPGSGHLPDTWLLEMSATGPVYWRRFGDAMETRADHAAVFVPEKQQMIVFAGSVGGTSLSNSIAIFHLALNEWSVPTQVLGTAPSKRYFARALYVSSVGKMFTFGGSNGDTYYNDLYAYHLDSSSWAEITPSGQIPSVRDTFALFPLSCLSSRPTPAPTPALISVPPVGKPTPAPTSASTSIASTKAPTPHAVTDSPTAVQLTLLPSASPSRLPTSTPLPTATPAPTLALTSTESTGMPTNTYTGTSTSISTGAVPTSAFTEVYPTGDSTGNYPTGVATGTLAPSQSLTAKPTAAPTRSPTVAPSSRPTTTLPSTIPSFAPSGLPSTLSPTDLVTIAPSSFVPLSSAPSMQPSSLFPSALPFVAPSDAPSDAPSVTPSAASTSVPTVTPSVAPSAAPSFFPSSETAASTASPSALTSTHIPSATPTFFNSSAASITGTGAASTTTVVAASVAALVALIALVALLLLLVVRARKRKAYRAAVSYCSSSDLDANSGLEALRMARSVAGSLSMNVHSMSASASASSYAADHSQFSPSISLESSVSLSRASFGDQSIDGMRSSVVAVDAERPQFAASMLSADAFF